MSETEKSSDFPQQSHLAACCGAYCGSCLAYHGEIASEAQALHERIERQGFLALARRLEPGEQENIDAFFDVLGRIARTPACPGCGRGGGISECPVRRCCRDRELDTCAACAELSPCAQGDLRPRSSSRAVQRAQRQSLRQEEQAPFPWTASQFLARLIRKYDGWNMKNMERIRDLGLKAWLAEMIRDPDFRSVEVKRPIDIYSREMDES